MGKKKTTFVWVLIVLLCLSLLFGIYQLIGEFRGLTVPGNKAINVISIAIMLISMVLVFILLGKLFNVTKDVQKWVNIVFGYNIIATIITFVLAMTIVMKISSLLIGGVVIYLIIRLAVIGCMWLGISMHLKRAKKNKLMDFS